LGAISTRSDTVRVMLSPPRPPPHRTAQALLSCLALLSCRARTSEASADAGSLSALRSPLVCRGATCATQCQAGDAHACFRVADAAIMGEHVPPAKLARLEPACTGGASAACALLADLMAAGRGVTRDDARATQLYGRGFEAAKAGCSGGDARDCDVLALLYERGKGTGVPPSLALEKDTFARAAKLERDLCDAGRADACLAAAERHAWFAGKGVCPEDAEQLRERACRLGEQDGCFRLTTARTLQHAVGAVFATPEGQVVVEVLGADFPDRVQADEPFVVRTYLRVRAHTPDDWEMRLQLRTATALFDATHVPVGGAYPTSRWKDGELLVDTAEVVHVPTTGAHRVVLSFARGAASMRIQSGPADETSKERVLLGTLQID
jgi:hypothetical protein